MARKELDSQEVVLWVLAAVMSVGLTVSFILIDQKNSQSGCISPTEFTHSGILFNADFITSVCKD